MSYVSEGRLPQIQERQGVLELAPDLAIEVMSPSDSHSQVTAKVMTYLEAGTQLVWVVDPDRRTVLVYTPDRRARLLLEDEEIDGGDALPGFRTKISEFFR
ncbi:MAG: Uma2 family endonuclease [Chloroflexota bacterium]